MNTPVSFPIAKLLKEKGFDEQWNIHMYTPTIAEVVMWLYEKHGIWISVEATDDFTMFCFRVRKKEIARLSFNYNSPTEAYEAAIDYILNNLI